MSEQLYPWLEQSYRSIISSLNSGRLPHALLIEGGAGLGKLGLAKLLAGRLLCERSEPEVVLPCGTCKQCLLFDANSHLDFRLVEPEDAGKAIKVDHVRALVDFVMQSSSQGGYKVAIIAPAEAMNINSANAILKTLEEPTPNTMIILVTHEPGRIMPTIRSRCQSVVIPKPSASDSMAWLAATSSNSQAQLETMLAMANGSPLLALSYIEESADELLQAALEQLAAVLKRQQTVSEIAEIWSDEHAATRLTWLCLWAQDLVMRAMFGQGRYPLPESAEKMFDYVVEKSERQQLFDLVTVSTEQRALFMGVSNPNKTLLFEFILSQWLALIMKKRA